MDAIETWRRIEGFDSFYEVSDIGNVRSLARTVNQHSGFTQPKPGVMLGKRPNKDGYISIVLSRNGVLCTALVHRIVAKAFIPNPESKRCVNHINRIKSDNSVNNLEWVTHSENMLHSYKTGRGKTSLNGEQCHSSKLTNIQRKEIASRRIAESAKALAAEYGVSRKTIRLAVIWAEKHA